MPIESDFFKNEWTLVPFIDKRNTKKGFALEKGLGVTVYGFADRHSGTITDVYKNKNGEIIKFKIKEDRCRMIDSKTPKEFSKNISKWECQPDLNANPKSFNIKTLKGRHRVKKGNQSVMMLFGVRDYFYEYTF